IKEYKREEMHNKDKHKNGELRVKDKRRDQKAELRVKISGSSKEKTRDIQSIWFLQNSNSDINLT
ncbi:29961_t:CDS:2, partial [Gigaspora margarita]